MKGVVLAMNRLALRHGLLAVLLVMLALGGCSSDPEAPVPEAPAKECPKGTTLPADGASCEPGNWLREDGSCQPAGLPPDMPCPPGEYQLEGYGCAKVGLPPNMKCPPGEYDLKGHGCVPAGLPPNMPCLPGEVEKDGGGASLRGFPPEKCAARMSRFQAWEQVGEQRPPPGQFFQSQWRDRSNIWRTRG